MVCVPWAPIFRVLPEVNVSRLAGDASGLRLEAWPGRSSPKRRRLALPAAGELYLSWTDRGEGGTSGRESASGTCVHERRSKKLTDALPHPPLRALPWPDLNSLMRGWMMGERATRGRRDGPPPAGPEPVSRQEEKFTCGETSGL